MYFQNSQEYGPQPRHRLTSDFTQHRARRCLPWQKPRRQTGSWWWGSAACAGRRNRPWPGPRQRKPASRRLPWAQGEVGEQESGRPRGPRPPTRPPPCLLGTHSPAIGSGSVGHSRVACCSPAVTRSSPPRPPPPNGPTCGGALLGCVGVEGNHGHAQALGAASDLAANLLGSVVGGVAGLLGCRVCCLAATRPWIRQSGSAWQPDPCLPQ